MSRELRVGFAEETRTQIYNLARKLESLHRRDTPMEKLRSIITPFEKACVQLRQTLSELHKQIDTLNPEDTPVETQNKEMLIKLKSDFGIKQRDKLSQDLLRKFHQKQVIITANEDVLKGYLCSVNFIGKQGSTELQELRISLRDELADERSKLYTITPDAEHQEVKFELDC